MPYDASQMPYTWGFWQWAQVQEKGYDASLEGTTAGYVLEM